MGRDIVMEKKNVGGVLLCSVIQKLKMSFRRDTFPLLERMPMFNTIKIRRNDQRALFSRSSALRGQGICGGSSLTAGQHEAWSCTRGRYETPDYHPPPTFIVDIKDAVLTYSTTFAY